VFSDEVNSSLSLLLGVERRKEKKRQKSEQGVVVEEIRRRRWGAGEMGLVHCKCGVGVVLSCCCWTQRLGEVKQGCKEGVAGREPRPPMPKLELLRELVETR
jgi:hypothetical protein